MDRSTIFNKTRFFNRENAPPAEDKVNDKSKQRSAKKSGSGVDTTDLPSPTISSRPAKLDRAKFYGAPGSQHGSASARGSIRSSAADLPKTFPVLKKFRPGHAGTAGVTTQRNQAQQQTGSVEYPTLPTLSKEGTKFSVKLRDKNDLLELVAILQKSPDVTALKIEGDFGGESNSIRVPMLISALSTLGDPPISTEPLDNASFCLLLSSLKKIQSLELSGCKLTEQNFIDLAAFVYKDTSLQTLVLGGGDWLTMPGQVAMGEALAANATLRELVLDKMVLASNASLLVFLAYVVDEPTGPEPLLEGIAASRSLDSVKLCNLSHRVDFGPVLAFNQAAVLFSEGSRLREVSFAGTSLCTLEPNAANDDGMANYLAGAGLTYLAFSLATRRQDKAPLTFGKRLEVLDFSGCALTGKQTHHLVSSLPYGSNLTLLNLDKNDVSSSDSEALQHKLSTNKPTLLEEGTNAFQWLISQSVNAPPIWPRDISRTLAMHTPIQDLRSLGEIWKQLRSEQSSSSGTDVVKAEDLPTTTTDTRLTLTTTTATSTTATTTATTSTTSTQREGDEHRQPGA